MDIGVLFLSCTLIRTRSPSRIQKLRVLYSLGQFSWKFCESQFKLIYNKIIMNLYSIKWLSHLIFRKNKVKKLSEREDWGRNYTTWQTLWSVGDQYLRTKKTISSAHNNEQHHTSEFRLAEFYKSQRMRNPTSKN